MRIAIAETGWTTKVRPYLPNNYTVVGRGVQTHHPQVIIAGIDSAGWTLDGYVIPRLASANIACRELAWEEGTDWGDLIVPLPAEPQPLVEYYKAKLPEELAFKNSPVRIGAVQQSVLRALKEHDGWEPGCGWSWDSQSGTKRILDTLVKRSLVQRAEKFQYSITNHGVDYLARH